LRCAFNARSVIYRDQINELSRSTATKQQAKKEGKGGRHGMILQDNDPHHMHTDFSYFYYFLILAPVIAALLFYGGVKLLNYLESQRNQFGEKPDEKNPSEIRKQRDKENI